MSDTATQSADADGGNMLSYKVTYVCNGYTESHCEIDVLLDDVKLGFIIYFEDALISCEPSVFFFKWAPYYSYEEQMFDFDPLKVAQDTLLEYYLLEQNRITIR